MILDQCGYAAISIFPEESTDPDPFPVPSCPL